MKILVSLINVLTPGRAALGVFDPETAEYRPLSLRGTLKRCNGMAGLASNGRYIFVVVQSPPALFVFDAQDFSPVSYYAFPSALDVHSLLLEEGRLFTVSAGTDEVLELGLNGADVVSESVIWRPEPSLRRFDFHHLNGICRWGDDILVSGFGKRAEGGWGAAANGFVHNITRDVRLVSGLQHPHSVTVIGGRVAFCESRPRLLRVLGEERAVTLPGYTRGLCADGTHVFVGTSKPRRVSKSTGQVNQASAPASAPPRCTISRLSAADFTVHETVDISARGSEVYDLLPVEDTSGWELGPASDPASTSWWQQMEQAMCSIAELTPPDSTLVLAGGKEWAVQNRILGRPRMLLSKPKDGEGAVRELERLRRSPAHYLVFAWTAFWWLDYYPELRRHVQQLRCLTENDHVMVFDLRSGPRAADAGV